MKYRKMGNLGWEVSALGFGAMRLPYKKFPPRVNSEESIKIIRRGIDLGINYVDTAFMYTLGASEKIVGAALKDGYREKVHLVTKLPTMMVKKEEDFEKYLHKQLEKLQADYFDVYLFHHLNNAEFEKVKKFGLIKKMEKAKEDGLIKHFGFSFHDTLPVLKNILDYYNWEVVQVQYNYIDTGIQATTDGVKYAHEKGCAVVIMEPLKGGYLANPPKEARQIIENAPVKRSPVDWALQFLWNMPEISVVLSGMGSMQMVENNCASADHSGINTLSPQELDILNKLAELSRKNIAVPCTSCKYCMPCPSGVNIPQNFALLNNANMQYAGIQNKVVQLMIKRRYRNLSKTKEEVKQRPDSGNASLCIKCNQCVPKCPQSINIPVELEKVDSILGKGKK